MCCLKYMVLAGPRYMGPKIAVERGAKKPEAPRRRANSYTGW